MKPPVAKDADLARKVIDKFASTVADDLELVNDGSKESLFQQLIAGEIFSTRISHTISLATLKVCWMVLSSELYSPEKMKKTTWQERTEYLTKDGYAHYREKTASFLGESAKRLSRNMPNGDLNKAREEAGKDASKERKLLKQFKGLGDTGVNIFFRDVQVVWPELYPHIDGKAVKAAQKLGLGSTADDVASHVYSPEEYAKLIGGLVRVELDHAYDELGA